SPTRESCRLAMTPTRVYLPDQEKPRYHQQETEPQPCQRADTGGDTEQRREQECPVHMAPGTGDVEPRRLRQKPQIERADSAGQKYARSGKRHYFSFPERSGTK